MNSWSGVASVVIVRSGYSALLAVPGGGRLPLGWER